MFGRGDRDEALPVEDVVEPEAAVVDAEAAAEEPRPEWLPQNFRSPQAMAESYFELQRKLTEMAEQAKQREAELEQRDLLLQQAMSEIRKNPEVAAYSPARQYVDQQTLEAIRMTAAAQARQQVTEAAFRQVPGLAENISADMQRTNNHVQEVAGLLDRHLPDWQQFAGAIGEAQVRHPDLFADPDANVVAQRIAGVVQDAKMARANLEVRGRTGIDPAADEAKRLAQTATGAGTRVTLTGDQAKQEWDAIKAANPSRYEGPRV